MTKPRSTLARVRARRARELQEELQSLARFRRSSRRQVAAIARAWRPLSKRLARAVSRMNLLLPVELALPFDVESPQALTAALVAALDETWALADGLEALRKLGPKLSKIEPAKARNRKARVAATKAAATAERRELVKMAHVYEQMADDLADATRFANRLHNANAVQRMERKPEYTPASYRRQLSAWVAEYAAKLKAVGA